MYSPILVDGGVIESSTAGSIEAAVSELKRKMPGAAIPSADTVLSYIYENDIEEILSPFRRINSDRSGRRGASRHRHRFHNRGES